MIKALEQHLESRWRENPFIHFNLAQKQNIQENFQTFTNAYQTQIPQNVVRYTQDWRPQLSKDDVGRNRMKNDDPGFPRSFLCILDTDTKKKAKFNTKNKKWRRIHFVLNFSVCF